MELVGHDEEAVRILAEGLFDHSRSESVQACLVQLRSVIVKLPAEGHDGFVGRLPLAEQAVDRVIVIDGALDADGADHAAGAAADAVGHRLVEVLHHDTRLLLHRLRPALHEAAQLPYGLSALKFGVVSHLFADQVIAAVGGVTTKHVEDEALLDGLLHRVDVEGAMARLAIGAGKGFAEGLERLVLGRGRKGVEVGIGGHAPAGHVALDEAVYFVLAVGSVGGVGRAAEHPVGIGAHLTALAGMGLIDDDSEALVAQLAAHVGEDEGEFMDGGDDDLLAVLEVSAQLATGGSRAYDVIAVGEGAEVIAQLLVEVDAVGDEEDAVEEQPAVANQLHQLIGQPGDAV